MAKVKKGTKPDSLAAEYVKIKDLKPWKDNPRVNEESAKKLSKIIDKFGFGSPVVARKANNEIIAGHTRIKAAEILGIESVPVRFMDLSARDAHQMALADNRSGEFAEWDIPVLQDVMGEFSLEELELAGWDEAELSKMSKDLVIPDGGVIDDPEDECGTIIIEIKADPALCGDYIAKLKEFTKGYDGIELNIS